MKVITLLSSIALVLATQGNPPPRSVNVALETSFIFDPKDMNDNKSFVNKIRVFLDKLYKILEPTMGEKQFRTETKLRMPEERRLGEFIGIMQNIGQNFLNMTGPKIKEALDSIHVEVKNLTEKHQPLLLQVLPTRTQEIFKDLIDTWMKSDPEEIKLFINSTVIENKPLLRTFARRLNNYYTNDEVKKLNKILNKFRRYINNDMDTTKIVKKLVHNTIIRKYDKLNDSAKAAVMGDLEMLSEFLKPKNRRTGHDKNQHVPVLSQRNSPSHGNADKAELPDLITYTGLRRVIDEKLRNAREKNENKKTSGNEVVVDKLELFVEPSQNS